MALRSQRLLLAAGLLAAAALIASCGGGTDTVASDTEDPASSTTAASSTNSGGSVATTTTLRPEREYPGGGPIDPVVPPNKPAYSLISAGACRDLLDYTDTWDEQVVEQEGEDTTPLYRSAALVCLGRWSEARQQLRQIDVAEPRFANRPCARTALLAWVVELIREWEADPTFSPVFVASSTPSPCPDDSSDTTDPDDTTDTSDPDDTSDTTDPADTSSSSSSPTTVVPD